MARDTSWFEPFVQELEQFAAGLPGLAQFERDGDLVSLKVVAPSSRHRVLTVEAQPSDIDYSLGKLWSEFELPDEQAARYVLAACDAVRQGRVREVRDRRSGLIYHVYRLTSRGFDEFSRDSQFSFRHWFKRKIRKVAIKRLPPLTPSITGY